SGGELYLAENFIRIRGQEYFRQRSVRQFPCTACGAKPTFAFKLQFIINNIDMKINFIKSSFLLVLATSGLVLSCKNDDPGPINEGQYKYVLMTGDHTTNIPPGAMTFYDEYPTGTVSAT